MCKFSVDSKEKMGNAVRFILGKATAVSKTKLMKLLYLMEQEMVLRFHTPFLGLPYEVWQYGPVEKDLFIDLSDGPMLLEGFVHTSPSNDVIQLKAEGEFSDDEFSDNELTIMNDVMSRYGKMSASQLVDETHKPGGLWYNTAVRNNLLTAFQNRTCNSSSVEIDFSELLTGEARDYYLESLNIRRTANLQKAAYHV